MRRGGSIPIRASGFRRRVRRRAIRTFSARRSSNLPERDSRVVGVTPAMPSGCSMNLLMQAMPSRCFDVGIAEGHAVTFSAGLAAAGMVPFCNIYSTFMQRAYDNVIHDVAIQDLPVVMCLDRGRSGRRGRRDASRSLRHGGLRLRADTGDRCADGRTGTARHDVYGAAVRPSLHDSLSPRLRRRPDVARCAVRNPARGPGGASSATERMWRW